MGQMDFSAYTADELDQFVMGAERTVGRVRAAQMAAVEQIVIILGEAGDIRRASGQAGRVALKCLHKSQGKERRCV